MEIGLEEYLELIVSLIAGSCALLFFLGFLTNSNLDYSLQNIIDFFISTVTMIGA